MMVFLKKLHKWIGLLIGLQVLLWLLSGLVISLLDPAKVSGGLWARPAPTESQPLPKTPILEPFQLPAAQLRDALGIDLAVSHGKPVYRIRRAGGETLVNAVDGTVALTGEAEAKRLALHDFTGDGKIVSIQPGTAPDVETRDSSGEYWKVNFSDDAHTTLYISTSSGEILERRNRYWRVRDFFWMLHIMDYSGRENFNNPLVIVVILIAVWLGISGFILLFKSFNRHDFFFLGLAAKPSSVAVTLIDPALDQPRQISLRKGSNLFLSLATHNINLPSVCGGGGECGQCRVKMEAANLPAPNSIEQGLVPGPLRKRGFRLACQHELDGSICVHLPRGTLGRE